MLTDLEFKTMDYIAHHEMNTTNGATPTSCGQVDTWLWPDEYAADLGINEHQLGGVLTSLQTKKYVYVVDPGTNEAAVGFTPEGFTAWFELRESRKYRNIK